MILRFPSIEILQLALTSEVVAQKVQCTPARAAVIDDDAVLIETTESIDRQTLGALTKLGVETRRRVKADLHAVVSWHQILPIVASAEKDESDDKTDVLFEIDGDEHLPLVVTEMLRLGNDRQSFRYVGENGSAKTLLRVTAPPYYTMLRATERFSAADTEAGIAITAYVQQSSRVWVEVGYRHPLGNRLNPPAGKWLLISRDNRWRFLTEGAFRDLYEAVEFVLPQTPASFVEREPSDRIRVPLKLTSGSGQEPAELWVVTDNPMRQIEQLIRSSDDQLISRIAFAVAKDPNPNAHEDSRRSTSETVILRIRPSKQLPPVLVLRAIACRPYLKIPNLFLPVAQRLHPPLRRDAVVKLLAKHPNQITWLMPDDEGQFTPQSIPDASFRPLSDWVDYVIDRESEPLQAWIASHRFDFEHFVCRDDEKNKPAPPRKRRTTDSADSGSPGVAKQASATKAKKTKKAGKRKTTEAEMDFIESPTKKPERSKLQLQLRELETDFLQSSEPLDSPLRATMWKEMALTNAELNHRHDSTICWVNSIWDQADPDAPWITAWLRCEQHCSQVGKLSLSALDELITARASRSAHPSLVAAYLVWAAVQDETPAAIAERRTELTQYLVRQEDYLPVRAAWLAWWALYKMSGNDVLLLARARDRLLERLFNQGLAPEFDMAAFMRTGGVGDSDRFRVLRDELLRLRELVLDWIAEPKDSRGAQTKSYAELMFAYALARLGEVVQCNEMLEKIEEQLDLSDPIHKWYFEAIRLRIKQALAGKLNEDELSSELVDSLESMSTFEQFKINRLRAQSPILEPQVGVNAFRRHFLEHEDDVGRELAILQDVVDRDELRARIDRLLVENSGNQNLVRIMPVVLRLSPRIGEKFAFHILDHVPSVLDQCVNSTEKTVVLQSSLQIAAHYGRIDAARGFVAELIGMLPEMISDYFAVELDPTEANRERTKEIESLLTGSFRGLRKLGMRAEIGELYNGVAEIVRTRKPSEKQRKPIAASSLSDRLLLCVARGWFYFGQDKEAREVVDKVQAVLKKGEFKLHDQRPLARAYLYAASQAPAKEAIERFEKFFSVSKKGVREVPNINDEMATSSHFSITQLDVVEAAVMSLISDDFSLSADARRWLDEDEFLVRSRIHRDMHQAAGS